MDSNHTGAEAHVGRTTEQKATKDESAFKKGWYFCDKTDQLSIIKNMFAKVTLIFFARITKLF